MNAVPTYFAALHWFQSMRELHNPLQPLHELLCTQEHPGVIQWPVSPPQDTVDLIYLKAYSVQLILQLFSCQENFPTKSRALCVRSRQDSLLLLIHASSSILTHSFVLTHFFYFCTSYTEGLFSFIAKNTKILSKLWTWITVSVHPVFAILT